MSRAPPCAVVSLWLLGAFISILGAPTCCCASFLERLGRLLTGQRPELGTPAIGPANWSTEYVASSYDRDFHAFAHQAIARFASNGSREGPAPPCDRSGGKCAVCALTRGSWCEEFFRQDRVPWKPAPRGSKDCPSTKWGPCNGVGNCHYDIGVCQCPAEQLNQSWSHVGPEGLDLDLTAGGWTASRCGGMCDVDRASCWCPPNTKYGRKPPPPDSPPWVRYSTPGRPISEQCKPGRVPGPDGKLVDNDWGKKHITLEDLVGPKGWCNADSYDVLSSMFVKGCGGWRGCPDEFQHGTFCQEFTSEETCLNQCSGHGECDAGYCRCHKGWYGEDCARKKAGEEMEPGHGPERPWLRDVLQPVPAAATEPPSGGGAGAGPPGRLRPLIYVYDMPPEFTTRMHQYKLTREFCGYREFLRNNSTKLFGASYSIESYLHEMLLLSPHRTFDPEEADFFYVPVYYTCFMWPVNGWADFPFWGAPSGHHRFSNAAHMWLAAKRWVQANFPFWDRRGGRDHIWLTNHDEGACYMPTEIYNTSIMLTHWGRMDLKHSSNTGYNADNYNQDLIWPGILDGKTVKTLFQGHPCYDPRKDLVIPGFKPPKHYAASPFLGRLPYKRDMLLYLRGDVGTHRSPNYSRGIRQKLFKLAQEQHWSEKHSIFIGDGKAGDYSEHLARSVFCAVVPGDGYAMRFEDAVLHGCLPLIIMDRTHALFESILDIDSFSIRIKEAAVDEHLPSLLKSFSPEQIERMQRKLALVWHRFAYGHGATVEAEMRMHRVDNAGAQCHASFLERLGRLLTGQRPEVGTPAIGPANWSTEYVASSYDRDFHAFAHQAIARFASNGSREGAAPPCDRSGGKCAVCALTRGSWCEEFFRQDRVPWKPAPRGSKDCPSTKWGPCNGVGNCHYDIGVCQCPAGWTGKACDERQLRPCTHMHKTPEMPPYQTISHVGPDGMDLALTDSGWTASRCGGFCDVDRASCWCPPDTKYGRKPAPPESPPWVRYSVPGRPLMESCKPGRVPANDSKDAPLVATDWGNKEIALEDLTGPKGWCNADEEQYGDITEAVKGSCGGWRGCPEEYQHGEYCDEFSETPCLNQCSGHGECDAGYCRCHKGWYGEDCARKKAGEDMEPGHGPERPWLRDVLQPVPAAATEPPSGGGAGAGPPGRLRPLIYVYDMPPEFSTRMHQYKLTREFCGYREFKKDNTTGLFGASYSIESYLHEMLLLSPHRTFDPEEADFFYVPVYYTCFMWPINGWADFPFWGAPSAYHRFSNAAHMWLAAKRWVQANFPFWDRRGGRDHIWLTNHDEGACYMPTEIYNTSIMLTHWGRMDLNHSSNTGYDADNYNQELLWPGILDGKDVRTLFQGHPCYDPRKDLVIPGFKPPKHYASSPFSGLPPFQRDILLYLRGDVGQHRSPSYSRGIRQKLFKLAQEYHWGEKHAIYIGSEGEVPGPYSEHLARSVFCAVVPGDGYAMRFEDAVLHGCLPLIIMDRTHVVFESILDVDSFSIRIKEAAVDEHLPNLLKSISPEQIERMQRKLALVWHRIAYGHGAAVQESMHSFRDQNSWRSRVDQGEGNSTQPPVQAPDTHPYQPVTRFPVHADALATILQWLHGRQPHADTEGAAFAHKAIARYAAADRPEGFAPPCDIKREKCAVCALTRGSWCEEFFRQERVPWKPAPRGSKDCPSTQWGPCNSVGNCHYDIGVCQCPAGWQGPACDRPLTRPCTKRHRGITEPLGLAVSHVGPEGLDLDLAAGGWTASRCGGMCDVERGSCWCPPFTKYGRKPPPPDAPPWVRWSQRGRPLILACKAGLVPDVRRQQLVTNDWGQSQLSLEDLWGPLGLCSADYPDLVPMRALEICSGATFRGCGEEGLSGALCDAVTEETCLNQCSGHGECDAGYCRCFKGWYGEDCARKKAGEEMEPGHGPERPWLRDVLQPVPAAATEPPSGGGGGAGPPGRLRPLIYVYDMPPEFTTRMHQYKLTRNVCGYRQWENNGTGVNSSRLFADGYSIESYLHEMLLLSPHRTFNPEEADFFYVPVYYTCWMYPINGWADFPLWGAPSAEHRYSNAAHMWLAAKRWVQANFPFWDRRGGRDHIWLTNHDEGACYMPTEIYNTSIMLTHWGRLDEQHVSGTAYHPDNYSVPLVWPGVLDGRDVRTLYEGRPCYDSRKDLVIPGFKPPEHYARSPLLGAAPFERDILLYLRGDLGRRRAPSYSRGVRQKLDRLATEHRWAEQHRIFVGERGEVEGDYSEHLARSVFCAVVPGDGYAMRFEDAVLHGCLPLIIMDRTHVVFESILDVDSFSIRINEAAVNESLPLLLQAIPAKTIERMQRKLALVWHRVAYANGGLVQRSIAAHIERNTAVRVGGTAGNPAGANSTALKVPAWHPYQPVTRFPVHADAFSTLMQWLHGRIADTRGSEEGKGGG
ncbi:hypothetical protein HYH03_013047 [Edaphochlamys debaryana]|uniref:EGF-like domain-containing protein n=1 Tax=Edaphochlamys debaryana TaxID=47281 RepID=A0A835XNU7_9CHLO|nr:hypothetical protein HYH03_013047 [Edaphochlamys debaryana]|eukprot:KAG2488357.1 hypothetical protein HYH03_013047 [Edaphochlamys debaryana]